MITTLLHIATWLFLALAVTFNIMLWRLLRDTRGVTRLCHALREDKARLIALEELRRESQIEIDRVLSSHSPDAPIAVTLDHFVAARSAWLDVAKLRPVVLLNEHGEPGAILTMREEAQA